MAHTDEEHSEAQLLELLLAARDIPCPVCGYNLRAIASTNCPECGAKLDLRVGSTDLKLGPWLAAVLAVALPLGACAIWVIMICAVMTIEGMWASDAVIATITLAAAGILYGGGLAQLLVKRRRFWKWSRTKQRVTALIIGSASIFVLASILTWLARM